MNESFSNSYCRYFDKSFNSNNYTPIHFPQQLHPSPPPLVEVEEREMERPRIEQYKRYHPDHPDHVEVNVENFGFVEETFKKQLYLRLYVKEDKLKPGTCRKYTQKRGKWMCMKCNTRRNQQVSNAKRFARNVRYLKAKEAIYERNKLFVSTSHCSCPPFAIASDVLADILKNSSKTLDANAPLNDTVKMNQTYAAPPQERAGSSTSLAIQVIAPVNAAAPHADIKDESNSSAVSNSQNVHINTHLITEGPEYNDPDELLLREQSIASLPEVEIIDVKMEAPQSSSNNQARFILENPGNDEVRSVPQSDENEDDQLEEKYDPALLSLVKPTDLALKSGCKKLGLAYDNKGYQFWGEINVDVIKSQSSSINAEPMLSGFNCLAMFLNGKPESGPELWLNFNKKLFEDPIKGNYTTDDLLEMSYKFKEAHLVLFCYFLSCRIGVYENGILKKFGNWSTSETTSLTILIQKNGDTYAPVKNL